MIAGLVTNSSQLDDGSCTSNLQVGSDITAAATATPTFVVTGDGGLSSYAISIDGKSLGTYFSTGRGVVCIPAGTRIPDGQHVLTGTELAPHSGAAVAPLTFTVDTVPPPPPSGPLLADYADSGVKGDGITKYPAVTLIGTAPVKTPIQILANGQMGLGGATAEADGTWSATTVSLRDGTYAINALHSTARATGARSRPRCA